MKEKPSLGGRILENAFRSLGAYVGRDSILCNNLNWDEDVKN